MLYFLCGALCTYIILGVWRMWQYLFRLLDLDWQYVRLSDWFAYAWLWSGRLP